MNEGPFPCSEYCKYFFKDSQVSLLPYMPTRNDYDFKKERLTKVSWHYQPAAPLLFPGPSQFVNNFISGNYNCTGEKGAAVLKSPGWAHLAMEDISNIAFLSSKHIPGVQPITAQSQAKTLI